jgi:hypothetical protein
MALSNHADERMLEHRYADLCRRQTAPSGGRFRRRKAPKAWVIFPNLFQKDFNARKSLI